MKAFPSNLRNISLVSHSKILICKHIREPYKVLKPCVHLNKHSDFSVYPNDYLGTS